ncbi:MAG: tRNA dihydrouridine synthase DusB [Clostridia bacterium]|nr:tRNA dihydrouridine synthase DusB [Clostridia bacterium]
MKRTVNIGGKEYGNLWLAPMAGDGDRAFRLVCKRHGAEYMCSEMVSAKAICYGDKKTPALAKITPDEAPMAVQLFGSEPDFMAEAAAKILEYAKKDGVTPSAIDINAGCPVHKIVSNGEGSALMKDLDLLGRIVESTVKASSVPVTVKMRIGWDLSSINAVEAAKCVEAAGAAAVCVHARTRSQLYSPGVDISQIKKVKDAVKIPVIGNGDIFTAEDAIQMFEQTGCDGVAVARGALGNPWIFEEIRAKLEGTEFRAPTVRERVDTALLQLSIAVKDKGERTAVVESRRYLGHYVKGVIGAAKIRAMLCVASSVEEIASLLEKLCR